LTSFIEQGLSVANNDKFIGGYITAHYAQLDSVETLQIELRRDFYLDNKELHAYQRPSPNGSRFQQAQEKLYTIFSNLVKEIK